MNIKKLLEEWEVYSPTEEEENPGLNRAKFNSNDIRNIMMSYFIGKDAQDVLDKVRQFIDKMPDEWIVEFLRNQDDTEVKEA